MKHRHFKALTSLLLVVVMLASMLPAIPVFAADTEIVFNFGANGSATHADGSEKSTYSETSSGYTLTLSDMSKVYGGARDAKGNSCLKLGTASAAGKFTFTVPAEVTSVKIAIAKYKSNTAKVTINGTTTTLTKNSNDGAYDVITVDTSSTKTVSLTTVSGGYRAMVNSITFVVSGGSSEPDTPACEHKNTTTNDDAVDATCTTEGKNASVTCNDCGDTVTKQTTIAALGHNYVDGVCSRCGETAVIYQLVTNISDLKIGDSIIIVATGYDVALSTTQNNNNRAETAITKLSNQVVLVDSVQVLTLEAGTADNTFAFNTGSGYLYAAGGSSDNYLKTKNDLDNTGSWSIEIAEDGTATVKAQIEGRNWLRYNSNNKLFSCYSSGQQNIAIYKYPCPHTNATEYEEQPATCTENGHSAYKHCNDCGEDIGKIVYQGGCVDTNGDNLCDRCTNSMCTEHVWVDVKEVTPATCTTAGTKQQECSACHNTQEIEISALGHALVDVDATPATCTEAGKAAGKNCQRDGCDYSEGQEVIPATGHTYVDGKCSVCGTEKPAGLDGRYYIATIRSSGNYFYMTNSLGTATSERYQATDSGLTALPESIPGDDAEADQIFVLVQQNDGTYLIYAEGITGDEKYLGWTSGNSGTLVAEGSAVKLTADTNDDGTVSFHFAANDAERYLALNNNTGNDYFAFYKSGQKQNLTLIPVSAAPATPEAPAVSGWSVSLNAGTTIKVTCNVPTAWLADNPNATAAFVFENSAFAGSEPVLLNPGAVEYTFTLAPKTLNEKLYFVLTTDGVNEFNRINVSYENYKTQQNTAITQNPTLNALVGAIDKYNAAANLDPEDDTIEITTESFNGVATWGESEDAVTKTDTDGIFVADSFSVTLGQQIAVNIGIDTSKDYSNCNIAVSINDGDPVVAGAFADYIIKEGMIVIKGFAPTNLNDKISITITGDYSASTSFKLNSYLQYIYNAVDEKNNNAYAFSNYYRNMAAVTFQYGVAAEAYANNNQ